MRSVRVQIALYGDLTYDSRVQKEARTLSEAGYQVSVACLGHNAAVTDLGPGIRVEVFPARSHALPGSPNPFLEAGGPRASGWAGRFGWLWDYVAGLRAWGRSLAETATTDADAWHLHDLTALAAVMPFLPPGLPVVYDSHELFVNSGTASRLPRPLSRLLQDYERRLVARTAGVVTVNDEIARVLERRYRPRRLVVVANCPPRWSPPVRRPDHIRHAAGIPTGAPIALYHGGLVAGRGIERLFDAFRDPRLSERHLVLLGYGEMRETYLEWSRRVPWRGHVHVLGPVPPGLLLEWIASADVGLMVNPGTTLNDCYSSPNKLFECLAAGTPVVASDLPILRRVLAGPDGPLGVLCDQANTEDVARAISMVLGQSEDERRAWRVRCEAAARGRWNWETEAARLLGLYEALSAHEAVAPSPGSHPG